MSRLMFVATVHDALNDPTIPAEAAFKAGVIQAAVHCWYEGHIEGEAVAGRVQTIPQRLVEEAEAMPSPPFPARDSEALAAIVREARERFDERELIAAVGFTAALAWAGGYREGRACPGCTARATTNTGLAALVRADQAAIRLARGNLAELASRGVA
jgi:hypothetical protein